MSENLNGSRLPSFRRPRAASGGQLLIADPWPRYWYGAPWPGVTLLHAVKER
jgi:hypothetical protein